MFDLCVILFIILLPIVNISRYPQELTQSIFFVFGTIFLMLIGYMQKPLRLYKNTPLALLGILSFTYLFYKNWYVGSLTKQWINFNLMAEGFLYVLFGILLIKTIVENAKRYHLYYIALIVVILSWFGYTVFDMQGLGKGWSMTPILAFSMAGVVTLAMHRKARPYAIVAGLMGIVALILKWDCFLGVKWRCRIDFWKFCVNRIIESKGLGHGFVQNFNCRDGFVSRELWDVSFPSLVKWTGAGSPMVGWRNNDFLEITEYLGVIVLGLIVWFIVQTLNKAKISLAYFLFVSSIIMCFFQRTIFHPVKGGIIAVIIALMIMENKKCQIQNG